MTDELFTKFSAGRAPTADDFYTGKMFLLLQDPFGVWCGFHAPKDCAVEEPNLYESMRGKTDRSNRDDWINRHCKNTEIISAPTEEERFKKTLAAMARGCDGIIGAYLYDFRSAPGITGSVNLLFKINEGQSVFGNYHYKIVQLKRAVELKEHYIMQTALMNEVLSAVQGHAVQDALFILKYKEQTVNLDRIINTAHNYVEEWLLIKDGVVIPDAKKPPKAALPPWRVYANKYLFDKQDLVLLPHLNEAMRSALKDNGLKTCNDVANAGQEKIKDILKEPLATDALAIDAYNHAMAYKLSQPIIKQNGIFPPPLKKRNLYFDFEAIETFTKNSSSFIYLIGIWDKEENKYVSFVATTEAEEEIIFKQFADYAVTGADTALYHWTEYEVKKMASLAQKYPAAQTDLQKLINACMDLKIVIEKSFYLPSPSLSLKAVAPAFGFNWRQKDCGAMDSMVYFTEWLKTNNMDMLNKVLIYNEDDCKAMLHVEEYLKKNKGINL